MRIAYTTTYNSADVHAWSGTGFYMAKMLEKSGFHVDSVGDLRVDKVFTLYCKAKHKFYKDILSKNYLIDREPVVLKSYARQLEKKLLKINPDIVFSPSSLALAYLNTNKPVVLWTDATFSGMVNFYPDFTNLCDETLKNGYLAERGALERSSMLIFSSDWAAETAIEFYDVSPEKVFVQPFGANIENGLDRETIKGMVLSRDCRKCKLLFIGVDWERKGGKLAIEITRSLEKEGVPVELNIVGVEPWHTLPKNVVFHGFVSKKTNEGRSLLRKLFLESHFLLLPSRSDCSPIVIPEANSFGLPVLATDVGGIPTSVHDGMNGKLFSLGAGSDEYSEYIVKTFSSQKYYADLALSSFEEYSNRLNWVSAGENIKNLINKALC